MHHRLRRVYSWSWRTKFCAPKICFIRENTQKVFGAHCVHIVVCTDTQFFFSSFLLTQGVVAQPLELAGDRARAKEKTNVISPQVPSAKRLKFSRVATILGRGVATIHRWHGKGLQGIKLQAVRIGRDYETTEEWLLDFLTATNPGNEQAAIAAIRLPAEPQLESRGAIFERRADMAEAKLDAMLGTKRKPKAK